MAAALPVVLLDEPPIPLLELATFPWPPVKVSQNRAATAEDAPSPPVAAEAEAVEAASNCVTTIQMPARSKHRNVGAMLVGELMSDVLL